MAGRSESDRMRHALLLPHAFTAVLTLPLLAATLRAEPSLQIEQLTTGPRHHFFGYIGHVQTIPWNASGRYLVALESEFQDRLPGASDAANIVLIDTQRDNELRVVDQTRG